MTIHSSIETGIAIIVIDRALRKNALRLEDWEALAAAIAAANDNEAARAIILTARKPNLFCAGADIHEMAAKRLDPQWCTRKYEAVQACNHNLWSSDKPVIAAIDGDCIGGGCGLAAACDLRIAAPHARFGVTPAKLGIAYARFDTALLVAAVGDAQARRLLLTADLIDAGEALRIGLVHEVTGNPVARAKKLAHQMLALSPHSIAVSKHHLRHIQRGAVDENAESRNLFIASYARDGFGERLEKFVKGK